LEGWWFGSWLFSVFFAMPLIVKSSNTSRSPIGFCNDLLLGSKYAWCPPPLGNFHAGDYFNLSEIGKLVNLEISAGFGNRKFYIKRDAQFEHSISSFHKQILIS
jgi:hypothetical protein